MGKTMASYLFTGKVLVLILVLFHYPRYSNCHDDDDHHGGDGKNCPPHKKFVGNGIFPALNGTIKNAIIHCPTGQNVTFEMRYANNSLCECGTIGKPILRECRNKILNMELHFTLSLDIIPIKDNCYVELFYLPLKADTPPKKRVSISTWRENVANSFVAPSRATQTSVVAVVQPSPTTVFVPSSSAVSYQGNNNGDDNGDDDGGKGCPRHKKFVATTTIPADNRTLHSVNIHCFASVRETIVAIRYANNSLCDCAKVKGYRFWIFERWTKLLCRNKISDMEIHITLSVNNIPNTKQKNCYIIPYYLNDRGKRVAGGQVTISTWQKHLVNSSVVSSRATDFPMKTLDLTSSRAFTALPAPGPSISTKTLSTHDSTTPVSVLATQTSVVTSSLVSSSRFTVATVVQPSPTTVPVPSSSALSPADEEEKRYNEDLDHLNTVNISTVDIKDENKIKRILEAASNVIRSNRTSKVEEKDPGLKVVGVLQDLGKIISQQLELGNESQVTFQKITEDLVFGAAAINTNTSSGFAFPAEKSSAFGDEKIEIPQSVFTSSSGKAFFVGVIFNGVRKMQNETGDEGFALGSKVISAEVFPSPAAYLEEPVVLMFEKSLGNRSFKEDCSFWIENNSMSGEHGRWSTKDCMQDFQNKTHIRCACHHFTNFAVLFKITNNQDIISEEDSFRLLIITYVGLGLSILGCLLTFIIYVSLRNIKSDRSTIHTNLVAALGIADVLFLVTVVIEPKGDGCLALTMLTFFFYLAMFFWMLVEGIYIYLMVIKVFRGNVRRRRKFAYLVGWGCPAIIALITWAILRDDVVSKYSCWLSVDSGAIWAFVGPGLVIILFNGVILMLVMRTTWATFVDDKEYGGMRSAAKTFGAVIPILGVTWVFGVMAFNESSVVFQYIFAITNSIQGILIFILYCLVNGEVRKEVLRRVAVWQTRRDVSSSTGKSRPTYVASSEKLTTFNRRTQSGNATPDLSRYPLSEVKNYSVKIARNYSFEQINGSNDSENQDCEFAASSVKSDEGGEVLEKGADKDVVGDSS